MKQILLLIAIIIGLISVFLLTRNSSDSIDNPYSFNVPNIGELSKIEILAGKYEDMTFTKENDVWTLQRGHLARENAMDNLLEVIQHLEIKYIPERAALKNINAEMKEIGVEVLVYDRSGKKRQHYIIGGSIADERGTYLKLKEHDQPYVVHLPTLEGSVRGRFLMRYDEWRDRSIFKIDSEKIASVKVNYPRQQTESFELTENGVRNIAGQEVNPTAKIDQYVHSFDHVIAEAYENHNSNQDSIRAMLAFCEISVRLKGGSERSIKLYPIENYIEESLVTLENTPRINRYFVDTNSGDFMLVQQRIIGKLLRGYSYFATDE